MSYENIDIFFGHKNIKKIPRNFFYMRIHQRQIVQMASLGIELNPIFPCFEMQTWFIFIVFPILILFRYKKVNILSASPLTSKLSVHPFVCSPNLLWRIVFLSVGGKTNKRPRFLDCCQPWYCNVTSYGSNKKWETRNLMEKFNLKFFKSGFVFVFSLEDGGGVLMVFCQMWTIPNNF